jgi:hypothetical protein
MCLEDIAKLGERLYLAHPPQRFQPRAFANKLEERERFAGSDLEIKLLQVWKA